MSSFTIAEKGVDIFPSTETTAPTIYLNTFSGEGQKIYEAARAANYPQFALVAISDLAWNHDMAPWDSPAAFKNGEPFTGGAGETLHLLVEEIMPKAEKELPRAPEWRGIAGYSLAGLFALYAIYQTDVFTRVGCISGSLWFPGFLEYVFTHEPKRRPGCLYFSLGDKEAKTRNPALQTVQENTKAVQAFYRKKGIVTMFQMNRGNHFIQGAERVADGMKWLLKQ